jgi:hypothetical protein
MKKELMLRMNLFEMNNDEYEVVKFEWSDSGSLLLCNVFKKFQVKWAISEEQTVYFPQDFTVKYHLRNEWIQVVR